MIATGYFFVILVGVVVSAVPISDLIFSACGGVPDRRNHHRPDDQRGVTGNVPVKIGVT